MRVRKDGELTRQRILEAACEVFGERGYHDATHAEICERAGANIAAINYHFGSKEELYLAAFTTLVAKAQKLYPLQGGVSLEAPAEERLRAFVRALLKRCFDPRHLGPLHQIRMAEMYSPTGVLDEVLSTTLAKHREHLQGILRELLGPHASRRDAEFCELSIVSQCFMGLPGGRPSGPRTIFRLGPRDAEPLTDHIMNFSLAGIRAIRQKTKHGAA
jgi:TetR/AcrR family transcriptional regulator, regulator of cefoperazone and chloramphenicol sensitivity